MSVDPYQVGQPPAGMQPDPQQQLQQQGPPPLQLIANPEGDILHAMAVLAQNAASAGSAAEAHEYMQGVNSGGAALAALAKAGELGAPGDTADTGTQPPGGTPGA